MSEVFGLNQPRRRYDAANLAHRRAGRIDLVEQRQPAAALVAVMRIPEAVQTAESCRGQRFVDRRPVGDPVEALGGSAGVCGKTGRETVVEQAGMGRTAAMVDQSGNRRDAEAAQVGQLTVRPVEILAVAFPQQWIAQLRDAQCCKAFEIASPVVVPGQARLVGVVIAGAADRTFVTGP